MKKNIEYIPIKTEEDRKRRLRISPFWNEYGWIQVAGLVNLTHLLHAELGYNKDLSLAEVGSHMGESASIFCGSGLFSDVFLIDVWGNPFAETTCKNNISMFKDININLLKGNCNDIYKTWDLKVDVVYIDAGHGYDQVYKDITHWKKFTKTGGYMCGHDYTDHAFPEVVKAVQDHFPEDKILTFIDKSWAVKM